MFDVRPTKSDGSLDMEKIEKSERILKAEYKKTPEKSVVYKKISDVRSPSEISQMGLRQPPAEKIQETFDDYSEILGEPRRPNVIHLGKVVPDDLISISKVPSHRVFTDRKEEDSDILQKSFEEDSDILKSTDEILKPFEPKKRKRKKRKAQKIELSDVFSSSLASGPNFASSSAFVSALLIFSLIIPCFSYVQKGFETKDTLLNSGKSALGEFAKAKDNLASGQFEKASSNFQESYEILRNANSEVSEIGGQFSEILRFVPGISKVATANYLLKAGENLALSGKIMTDSVKSLAKVENPLAEEGDVSLTELFLNLRSSVSEASQNLKEADRNIAKANFSDLPTDIGPKFLELKEKLPVIIASLEGFTENTDIMLDVLGYNGPRKFLFLFQNNQEMRATGGFIGSYGILDISNGRVKKLFVDDIYNPDGQLTAKVIPPEPIQKMSAVWTMHDANWFPNFPTSAEKVAWFYEKTGGPTVDGVIAMTPSVIEKMISVTGPIEMPEYNTTVDEENFVEKTQYEVEIDYDKDENRPKKFIADLTPKILDKLLNTKDPKMMLQVINVLGSALKEKHILIYSKNYNIQKLISEQGWSGEMLNTSKDYLSVINTNINGYKTDGVIDETIEHHSNIEEDGSITDEVTITRKHNGGNEEYDWWNKVNGDYMRVYVPEGSKLLEASGQTREFVSPPLDYNSLQFKKDPQLLEQEQDAKTDESTGTRIYTEDHKTVFANWIYVSPGETIVLRYKYKLPFKLSFDSLHQPADTFSVLYQKQSGSIGSDLTSQITLPKNMKVIWRWPENAVQDGDAVKLNAVLDTDRFVGIAIER